MIGFIGIDLGQKGALTLQTKLPGETKMDNLSILYSAW